MLIGERQIGQPFPVAVTGVSTQHMDNKGLVRAVRDQCHAYALFQQVQLAGVSASC